MSNEVQSTKSREEDITGKEVSSRVRILDKEIGILCGTWEDYRRLVSVGTKREAWESLTSLVIECSEDGEEHEPFVMLHNDKIVLMYAKDDGIYVPAIIGENTGEECFQILRVFGGIPVHFLYLNEPELKTLENLLMKDFRKRIMEEFERQKINPSISEDETKLVNSYIRLTQILMYQLPTNNLDFSQKESVHHIYHDLTEFDPELDKAGYANLRNAVSRAKRAGAKVEKFDSTDLAQFNQLADRWNGKKKADFDAWKKEQQEKGKEVDKDFNPVEWPKRIAANIAYSPEVDIYTAKVGDEVVAALGVGIYGESAFMYFRHHDFATKGAMEYLEYAVMCELKARGVKTLSRGRIFRQNVEDDSLWQYKAKFEPLLHERRFNRTVVRFSDEDIHLLVKELLKNGFTRYKDWMELCEKDHPTEDKKEARVPQV